MTDQNQNQNPDMTDEDDTEGHSKRFYGVDDTRDDDDDTEGHSKRFYGVDDSGDDDDDTEGHLRAK